VLQAKLKAAPNDFHMMSALGIAYAGLGDRDKALEYGNRGRQLAPRSKDVFSDMVPMESMALIHTLLGDEDEAVQILDQLMHMPFSWNTTNTVPLLKMSPQWISLRGNAGFRKLSEL